ncbi:MAG: PDZ domain-containing protein [Planctomycetes bacterium]|nr:PDZ domain-containing protein [Planctomycetota bacterium]
MICLCYLVGLCCAARCGEAQPPAAALAAALDEVLGTHHATALLAEPAGEVSVDYAPNGRPAAVLAEAQRAEQERNWRRAAELYQRLLDEAPHELCHPSPRLYLPIQSFVEERLAALPPEGLAAYRAQADPVADALLRGAAADSDLGRLSDVARRFLLSSHGDEALGRLATAWLERGEAGRALRAWRRLLALCRGTDLPPGPLAAKLALCLAQLGQKEAALAFLARAADALGPAAKVAVAGQPEGLADFRLRLGSAIGNRKSEIGNGLRPGPLLWADVILPQRATDTPGSARRLMPEADGVASEPPVRMLPILAGGAAVYPTWGGVMAREATTGKLRWTWNGDDEAREWRASVTLSLTGYFMGYWRCSADDEAAYCAVPFAQSRFRDEAIGGYLAALDLRTGAQRWRRWARQLLPLDKAAVAWFASAPQPCGEQLVVGLRSGTGGDEYHLCALRRSDGALLWRTFIAGRASDPLFRFSRYEPRFEGMPAEAEGLVVACPGGGVVAGVELATGAIRWLARYDQVVSRRAGWRWYRHDGWRSQTPVIAGGLAYATPPDSDFAYAIDLASGSVMWRRERGDKRFLAGLWEGRACVVGTSAAAFGPRGEVEWQAELPSPAIGQPALAGRILHLPLAGGILFLDATTGSELAWTSWDEWAAAHGSPLGAQIASGDLVATGGKLFVATPHTLNVFSPFERREAIERQLAADPADPLAHYAKGQECHWAGDAAGAVEALEKALELAGRRPGAVAAPVLADARRRLGACHADLSRRHERAGRVEPALASCEAALRYVPPGAERQALLLRTASLAHGLKRWPAATAACQEVLGGAEPGEANWAAARSELDALLREAGRQPYEPFERLAEASLERGGEADLVAIVKRYPTSAAAPAALERLAERAGRPGEARSWLHQLAMEYPAAKAAPTALRRLAEGYAKEGATAMARGALERLRRLWPAIPVDLKLASDDRSQKLGIRPPLRVQWDIRPAYGSADLRIAGAADARERSFLVLAGRAFECRSLDDGALLWADRPGWIGVRIVDAERRGGGVRIMSTVASGDDAPAARAGLRGGDVLVKFDGKQLRDAQDLITTCTERRAGAAVRLEFLRGDELHAIDLTLGARPAIADDTLLPPASFLGVAGGNAIVRKTRRLDAVSVERGDAAWSLPLGAGERLTEGANDASASAPGIVALADGLGRILALDPATGQRLWDKPAAEPVVHDMALWEHGLVVASSRPATLRVLNPLDGHVAFEAAQPSAAGAPVFALDTGGRLCYAMGSVVGCWESSTGKMPVPPDPGGREGGTGLRPVGVAWDVRIPNIAVRRLWAGRAAVIAQGVDEQGAEVVEARQSASGAPAWSVALARGERWLLGELAPDAFYLASRQGTRTAIRRLDPSTGQVAWTQTLARQEDLAAWDAGGQAIVLGLTITDERGGRRAEAAVLEKAAGTAQQRLALGAGVLVSLSRLGSSLCAVVENEAASVRPPAWLDDEVVAQPARFRIVRMTGVP